MTASSKELKAHRKSSIHTRFDEQNSMCTGPFQDLNIRTKGYPDHMSLLEAQQARWKSVSASTAQLNPTWSLDDYCIARAGQD
jgi:hypothetical protein